MAAAREGPLNEAFDCPVCLGPFQNARILPCGHSLCGSPKLCLSKTLELSKSCPKCRHDMGSKVTEDDFPINYDLKSGIESLRSAKQTDEYGICDKHEKAEKFYCRSCETTLCENCWEEQHTTHSIIPFSIYKKEIQDQLSQSKLKMASNETKLNKIEEDYEKITSKYLSGGELLNEIKNLSEKKDEFIREVYSSRSFSEVSDKVTSFNSIDVKINELKQQFVREGYNIIREFGDVLSEMEASLIGVSELVEDRAPRASETDPMTGKFSVEVSSILKLDEEQDFGLIWLK